MASAILKAFLSQILDRDAALKAGMENIYSMQPLPFLKDRLIEDIT